MSELNLQQREGEHSEFNAATVVVAIAAILVNDIFEQTCMHALKTLEQHFDRDDAKSATSYSEKIPLTNCLPAFEAIAHNAKGGSSQILNMRAQYILHSIVSIGRMTNKSDRGIFSYLPDFVHKIFQEMCDEAAKLRCGAARALAPIVELHEASRIPIVEFYSGFVVGELQECMGIIQMNPPSAYLMAKGSRLGELKAMCKLELTKVASDNGIGNNLGYNLALFPNQKKNIINELMAKFDEEHSESVLAANLESEGAAKIVIQKMSAKIAAAEKERSGWRDSHTGVVAKGTAEAEPAREVDAVVDALRMY